MVEIFAASVFAGVVVGAPFGVAGAMVVDSALSHTGRRLAATVLAAVGGDLTLALLASLASARISEACLQYQHFALKIAGILVIAMGIFLFVKNLSEQRRCRQGEAGEGAATHWILAHAAPLFSVYLLALLHPGNVAAFLAVVAIFAIRFPDFHSYRLLFALGIAVGSGMMFCLVALLFWKIKNVADKFLHHFKYSLAITVVVAGSVLLIKGVSGDS